MGLKASLEEALKTALKSSRKEEVSTIRLTLSEIQNAEKEKRGPLEEEEIVRVLRSAVKKRKESIGLFRKGGRDDLAGKEEAEVRLLTRYLPPSLSGEELKALVDEAIGETGASSAADMGRVMKHLLPRTGGRADGAEVSRLVKERLSG